MNTFIVPLLSCFAAGGPSASVDFVRDVRPIFAKHCYSCHGSTKQRSGFRLDVKSEALKGGDTHRPAILPGKAADSALVRFVAGEIQDKLMPPKGERLSAAEIATLKAWINEGAVWPEGVDRVKLDDGRDHWSFQPLTNPVPPSTRVPAWPRNSVDRFILARLEKEGLKPAPPAERVTWLRRVSFDLTGLPPTPEQVAAFVKDARADAHERVVEALLNSPRYGERWAQHWLDVVRYADTHGFEVNTERPNAWPYRDYVIQAFNEDTPYDRFIREQLAGDALNKDAATGFLVTASVLLPGQIGKDAPSIRLARQDALDEIVINTGQTFLGLSVGCARCHDHKFDPIAHHEYYAMQAFFAGVEYGDRSLPIAKDAASRQEVAKMQARVAVVEQRLAELEPLAGSGVERPPVHPRRNTERLAPVLTRRLRMTIHATNNLEPCLDELEVFNTAGVNVALASRGTKVTTSGNLVVADRHEPRFLNDGHYGNARSWLSNEKGRGWVELEFSEVHTIQRVVWGRDREGKFADRLALDYRIEVATPSGEWRTVAEATDRRPYVRGENQPAAFSTTGLSAEATQEAKRLLDERKSLEGKLSAAAVGPLVFAGTFRTPDPIRLLLRGDPEQPTDEVAPAVPGVLGTLKLPKDAAEQERRTALADWIASPRNPLTARVLVNRVWQGHFGAGLVETPSDFGRSGAKPSHPELLDWLAAEFLRSGWSLKHLHRLIVLSATYRQGSRIEPVAQAKDADVRLLWRYPARRLEAEAIRDAMLAVSGRLNPQVGGRGFDLFDKRGGLTGFKPVESFREDGRRRMIYAHRVRRERDAVFGALDCPDNGQSTARRRESTTPIQALNLFNSRFTLDEAEAFAARLQTEAGADATRQIHRAYQLALSRAPKSDEISDALPVVREHGLATLCRVLFNSNEFLFLP